MKQQQELQALQQKLSDELASENQKNSLQLRDSINSFLKIYNQNKGYDLIISNTGMFEVIKSSNLSIMFSFRYFYYNKNVYRVLFV